MDQEFAPFCDGWSALGSTMSAGARALALSRPGPNGIRADDRAYLTGDNDAGRIALQSANRDCAGLAGQEGNRSGIGGGSNWPTRTVWGAPERLFTGVSGAGPRSR